MFFCSSVLKYTPCLLFLCSLVFKTSTCPLVQANIPDTLQFTHPSPLFQMGTKI